MGLKLKTVQASALKSLFEVLQSVLNDVNILFTKDTVRILTMDTAKVSLVHLTLDSENFEEYECSEDIIAGVNMSDMYKLLKSITPNDTLTIEINSLERMNIIINDAEKNKKTTCPYKLLDINDDLLNVPNMELSIVTTVPSVDFQRVCRDMNNLSKEITICRKGDVLTLSCMGDFADQITEITCHDDSAREKECSATYKLQYIILFTKATSMCSSVQIYQESPQVPVVFKYSVANLGHIQFYLAPNIEN